jgi:hypothetical protein
MMTEQLLTALIVATAAAYCTWIVLPSAARSAASGWIARLATRFGMGPAHAGRIEKALKRQSACSECASCRGCAPGGPAEPPRSRS